MIGSVYHGSVFVNEYFGEEGVSTARGKRWSPKFGQECEVENTPAHWSLLRSLLASRGLLARAGEFYTANAVPLLRLSHLTFSSFTAIRFESKKIVRFSAASRPALVDRS